MLAKRFRAFDAVYYSAPASVLSSIGAHADAVSADRSRCQGLPITGWEPHSFAYFRFGDLDERSQQQLRTLGRSPSKLGAHLADVVAKALGDGTVVGNASLLKLEAGDGTLGARFSLVFQLGAQIRSKQPELVVQRHHGLF